MDIRHSCMTLHLGYSTCSVAGRPLHRPMGTWMEISFVNLLSPRAMNCKKRLVSAPINPRVSGTDMACQKKPCKSWSRMCWQPADTPHRDRYQGPLLIYAYTLIDDPSLWVLLYLYTSSTLKTPTTGEQTRVRGEIKQQGAWLGSSCG